MTVQHTPGPWRQEHGCLVGANGTSILGDGIHNHDLPDEEREANARLIAAAPELLTACELLLQLVKEYEAETKEEWKDHIADGYVLKLRAEASASIAKAEAAIAKVVPND